MTCNAKPRPGHQMSEKGFFPQWQARRTVGRTIPSGKCASDCGARRFSIVRRTRPAPRQAERGVLSVFHTRCGALSTGECDRWSDVLMVVTVRPRMVCTRCGIIGADARPDRRKTQANGIWPTLPISNEGLMPDSAAQPFARPDSSTQKRHLGRPIGPRSKPPAGTTARRWQRWSAQAARSA